VDTGFQQLKEKLISILARHGVKRAALFGSCVRAEMGEDSDIDILVELDREMSLLDFIGLKLELEDAVGRKVDLVEYGALKPLLRDSILKDQVAII